MKKRDTAARLTSRWLHINSRRVIVAYGMYDVNFHIFIILFLEHKRRTLFYSLYHSDGLSIYVRIPWQNGMKLSKPVDAVQACSSRLYELLEYLCFFFLRVCVNENGVSAGLADRRRNQFNNPRCVAMVHEHIIVYTLVVLMNGREKDFLFLASRVDMRILDKIVE